MSRENAAGSRESPLSALAESILEFDCCLFMDGARFAGDLPLPAGVLLF